MIGHIIFINQQPANVGISTIMGLPPKTHQKSWFLIGKQPPAVGIHPLVWSQTSMLAFHRCTGPPHHPAAPRSSCKNSDCARMDAAVESRYESSWKISSICGRRSDSTQVLHHESLERARLNPPVELVHFQQEVHPFAKENSERSGVQPFSTCSVVLLGLPLGGDTNQPHLWWQLPRFLVDFNHRLISRKKYITSWAW